MTPGANGVSADASNAALQGGCALFSGSNLFDQARLQADDVAVLAGTGTRDAVDMFDAQCHVLTEVVMQFRAESLLCPVDDGLRGDELQHDMIRRVLAKLEVAYVGLAVEQVDEMPASVKVNSVLGKRCSRISMTMGR